MDETGHESQAPSALTAFGAQLHGRFDELVRDRRLAEQEWLSSLRQYLGHYGGGTDGLEHFKAKPEPDASGSKAFIRLTRAKVRAMDARAMDILFPAGADKNWSIDPTPEPDLPEDVLEQVRIRAAAEKLMDLNDELARMPQEVLAQKHAAGELPNVAALLAGLEQGEVHASIDLNEDEMDSAIMDEAESRAAAMSTKIEDQLEAGRYRNEVRKVVHSGHLYGTGWFKGPLAEKQVRSEWKRDPEGTWQVTKSLIHRPAFEAVSIWDLYPDNLDAATMDDLDGVFQRHIKPRGELRRLKRRPGFDGEAIERYIAEHPEGDAAKYLYHEEELRRLRSEDQGTVKRERRYALIEWTGYADAMMLQAAGIDEVEDGQEYRANIWLLGSTIIKATLTAYDDDTIETYHRYVFEESDTGIYGIGIPEIMRDPQRMFNASVRAMLDNMGLSSGPMYEIHSQLLASTEMANVRKVYPRKVWLRDDGKNPNTAGVPAVRVHQVDSRVSEFITVCQFALDLADEATTLPRYVTGDEKLRGAGKTASGLSMLMGASNIMLKEALSNFDLGITKPFLRAMYHWNMQFTDDDDIKGDFEIAARASNTLMAKEVHSERLDRFAAGTANPLDAPWIKRDALNRERAKANDLDPDQMVYTQKEFDLRQAEQLQAQEDALREQAMQNAAQSPPQQAAA